MENLKTIAALAGRRIDAPGTETPRFPLSCVPTVSRLLEAALRENGVEQLVCSAACGADLLALDAAERLGIAATIVLPFAPDRFRASSVTDRPGAWARLFDRATARAARAGALVDLGLMSTDAQAYDRATAHIIALTGAMPATRRLAIAVWEGRQRGDGDATADFVRQARAARFELRQIMTLE